MRVLDSLAVMDPDSLFNNKAVLALVPKSICLKYKVVPVDRIENVLLVATTNPKDLFPLDDIKFMTGFDVVPVQASEAAIMEAIDRMTGDDDGGTEDKSSEDDFSDSDSEPSPVIKAVNDAIVDALEQGASHIHFHPLEAGVRVSFRVDDVLREVAILPGRLAPAIVSRLKIMAKLDIAERRLPQDGRIGFRLKDGSTRSVVVNTLPTSRGERVVLAFDKPAVNRIAMSDLGFGPDVLERLKQAAQLTFGVVVIAGPPKSGRSTTLYSMLDYLNNGSRCILTAEDPIAYALDGIGQIEVNASAGLDYAALVRAILRHDPDAIMVRDTRDRETTNVVLEAASQHLVLTSVEADDARHALPALIGLGGSPQLVASAVRLVLAQRLVRRICDDCKADDPASQEALARLSAMGVAVPAGARFFQGAGCPACAGTGYRGRLPIGEVLTPPEADLVTTFAAQTLQAALAGKTTMDEYWRMIAAP